ncbi:MAG: hypothetical protein H7Y07_02155 [Pyrinomonadaceae bacterium]|nr:hypothetical protein [Sphingobacteriaceae bacterium]
MKQFALLSFLLFPCMLLAQVQQPLMKTIPGIITHDAWEVGGRVLQVSPDGKEVAFHQSWSTYILRPADGSFTSYAPNWSTRYNLSPDHSIAYGNVTNFYSITNSKDFYAALTAAPKPNQYAAFLGNFKDSKLQKVFRDTNYVLGINQQNQLIVTTAWAKNRYPAGMLGLRLVDVKTGKILKVLRKDTLFRALHPIYPPSIYFNSTYTALLGTEYEGTTTIFPFGTDSVMSAPLGRELRGHIMSDQHYIYTERRGDLSVFSLHSGKFLYKVSFPTTLASAPYSYTRCIYTQAGNGRLYRYDREQAAVYEEEVLPTGLRTIKTYPLHSDNVQPLPITNQWYDIAACAGPSLLITPHTRTDGDKPENVGYAINLPSGKVALRIAPFYNASAGQIAKEVAFRQSEDAYEAKMVEEKKAAKQAEITKELAAKYAECDRILAEAKMKIGTYYPMGALVYSRAEGASCRTGYAIWGFNCNTKKFTAAGLGTYDADAEKLNYVLCDLGPYAICPECDGHPFKTSTQYIKDDSWHQINFNVYKMDPNAVKKIDVTTTCKRCLGKGVVKI